MSRRLTRRAVLAGASATGLALATSGVAYGAETAYAAFRAIRTKAGEPSTPELILPDGYQLLSGAKYSVASRAEYYAFVEGPPAADGIPVRLRWPGIDVRTVVHQDLHLPIEADPDDPDMIEFQLPVTRTSINANQPTIQVWSHPDISPGMYYRIEHNAADRAAGPWTNVAWPAGEVSSVINLLIATHTIWRDSGMIDVAADKGHRFVLMGFETNNTLHTDNPPHWHISYNSGADFGSPTHNPHFWLDSDGRTFYNGMDVTGLGRLKYYAGDPAPIYDFVGDANDGRGNLVVTVTIREDGGLDIEPADGPKYAITPGRNGDLIDEVVVRKSDRPWLRIAAKDRVDRGILIARLESLQGSAGSRRIVYPYDRDTGVLR